MLEISLKVSRQKPLHPPSSSPLQSSSEVTTDGSLYAHDGEEFCLPNQITVLYMTGEFTFHHDGKRRHSGDLCS